MNLQYFVSILVHCESFSSFKDPNLYVGPFSFINHYKYKGS